MKTNRVICLLTMVALVLVLVACGMKKQENIMQTTEGKRLMELNQRQKDILRSKGLPETAGELSLSQLNAIVEIEKALVYLEEKYGKTFCYAGFVAQDLLSEETISCYEEGTPQQRVITVSYVYNNGDRSFRDNFREVEAGELYANVMQDYFVEKWNLKAIAAAEIYELRDEISEETVIKNSSALCRIFFSDENMSQERLKEIAEEFSHWLTSEQKGSTGDFRLFNMSCAAIEDLTAYNVEDIMNQYGFENRATVWITKDGFVRIE